MPPVAKRPKPLPTKTQWVLGIDGGGSKTLALLADGKGRIVGRGESTSSNHHAVGWAAATSAIGKAILLAKKEAGLTSKTPVAAIALGVAGVDTAQDEERLHSWVKKENFASVCAVVNDGALLLAAGGVRGPGLALVAGTGSICWGRNRHGQTGRAGGWGHLFSDEGSGYDLSMRALRLVGKTNDGRMHAQALTKALLRHLKLGQPADLLTWAYGQSRAKSDFAALAPVIFAMAKRNDGHALALLDGAAADLAEMVRAVCRRLKLRRPVLVVGGSLLVRQISFRSALGRRLGRTIADIVPVKEPARGAVVLACDLLKNQKI